MPHSNRDELSRLFGTFCHLWSKGLHANVQMKTTGSGGVVAQFEFELDKPHKSFPAVQASLASGEANPNVHHSVNRVTKQAPPMHQVTQEQREAAVVGHVVVAQKRSRLRAAAH